MSVCALFALPAIGCMSANNDSGSDDPTPSERAAANACTLEAGCGGNIEGRWRIHEICGDGTFTADTLAPGGTPVEQRVLDASGWVEFRKAENTSAFGPDGQYELDVTSVTEQVLDLEIDPDVLAATGETPEEYCDTQATNSEEFIGQLDSIETTWDCEVFSETTCRCDVETTTHAVKSGGYEVNGSEVELHGAPSGSSTFCVEDDSLHMQDSQLFRGVGLGRMADDDPAGFDAGEPDATEDDGGSSDTTGSFTATVDGQSREMPKLDVLEQGGALVVNGTTADLASTLSLNLTDPTEGTNECDSFGLTTMSYTTDSGATTYQAGGGIGGTCTIDLTTVEDGHLAGTFQAELQASQGSSGTLSVTNGTFDVQY